MGKAPVPSIVSMGGSGRTTVASGVLHALRRRALAPLFVVMAILISLVATPMLSSAALRGHRRLIGEVLDPARVAVNDLEAARASEVLATVLARSGDTGAADSLRRQAEQDKGRDMETLRRASIALGDDAIDRFITLRAVLEGLEPPARDAVRDARRQADALRALDAFENWLTERTNAERATARGIESWNFYLTAVLVLLAFVATMMLARTQSQIVALADARTRDHEALVKASSARAALMRGVTHDLKNPLGAALGYAELLEDGIVGPIDAQGRAVAARMKRLLATTIDALNDLLELARTESAELSIAAHVVDLDSVIEETIADHAAAARTAGLALEALAPSEPVRIATDPARVRQILGNLIGNAIKFTPRGGRIAVELRRDPQEQGARVLVRDTGPGIPAYARERVFDEFFRLPMHEHGRSSDHGSVTGSGIGLAISRRLAHRLGGDLTADGGDQGGAQFTLTLPGAAVARAER